MAKKILVIDDEMGTVRLLESRLSKKGFEVATALNGKVGLEKVMEFKPDLILLDVEMPVMNGYSFMMKIKGMKDYRAVPVVVLTSHADKQPIFQHRDVKDFLVKPVNFDLLFESIDECFNPKNAKKKESVLVIEGNATQAKLMDYHLKMSGFKDVVFSDSKEDGLKQTLERNPDIVIINASLPDGSGLDACENIIASNKEAPCVIILCDPESKVDEAAIKACGANEVVTKTTDYSSLIKVLRKVIDQ